jgi:hypothetical protein
MAEKKRRKKREIHLLNTFRDPEAMKICGISRVQIERPNYSVADPGCLPRIPDPDFYPSRIPDLGPRIQKQQQKRGVKKICSHTF